MQASNLSTGERSKATTGVELASHSATTNVCMLHAFDPRGKKIGGLETYVRDYIAHLPDDLNLLLVGVDELGDLKIGSKHQLTFRGRTFDFIPVLRVTPEQAGKSATRVTQSLTLNYLLAVLRHAPMIGQIAHKGNYTFELRRIEHALAPIVMRRKYIQMLHDGATRDKSMSSLLKRYWWVKQMSEKLSLLACQKFYCVSDELTNRIRAENPRFANKVHTLSTWANPSVFKPTPFHFDETIHLFFAGRLDEVKRPDLMFSLVAEVARKSDKKVAFHYVGDGEPAHFREFAAIEPITVRHGQRSGEEIAKILEVAHIGLLTSDFEGMPRTVLEVLTSGRPVVALHLPQLENVVREGLSGFLVQRGQNEIAEMAVRILETYKLMLLGRLDPHLIASQAAVYSPQSTLGRIYDDHRHLQSNAA